MSSSEEFEKKMENLRSPKIESNTYKQHFKMYLLNAKHSASIGFLLLIIPLIVIVGMVMQFNLGLDGGWMYQFGNWLTHLSVPIAPFVILGFPLVAILINLLAVTHFHYNKSAKEVNISIRLKWMNLLVLVVCALILGFMFVFLIVENVGHP